MHKLDMDSIGGPPHTRLHRTRAGAAVIAAVAGGLAFSLLAIAAIAGVAPAESPLLWLAALVSAAIWFTGLYWRWDAPDARQKELERERRGF